MLNDQLRRVLTWVTIGVVAVVVISGMVTLLLGLIGEDGDTPVPNILPADTTLCQGDTLRFQIEQAAGDVEWAATGGQISADGLYTAGDLPGDYEVQAAGPVGERGRAIVHIVACTPTPTATPTPTPTPISTVAPTATPAPSPDPQGDVAMYSGGAATAQTFAGIDMRNASIQPDGRVSFNTLELPPELAAWAAPDEVVLWIALYDAIPEAPPVYTEWVFVLDLDGNAATGRPAGSRPINPDLGDEVALAVFYDPALGSYDTYLLVWNAAQADWVNGPDVVRTYGNESRMLVGLGVPLETLRSEVARLSGVTVAAEAVRGRAATIAYAGAGSETWVADFYPDIR